MRYVTFSIVLLSILLGACDRASEMCVITVGDACITRQVFRDRLERFAEESMINSEDVLQEMKPVVAGNIVEEQLILQYAGKGFVTVTDQEVDIAMKGLMQGMNQEDLNALLTEEYRSLSDMKNFVRTRLLIDRTVEKAVKKEIAVPGEKIQQYYQEHLAEFYRPSSVELYHVFVRDKYQAKEALVMLRSGVPLEQVVMHCSESKDSKDSGFMGIFVKGELPREVEDVVFSIPERRYSEIIETQRGFHIFYVAKRTKPGTLPLVEAADQIRDDLEGELFEEKYSEFIEGLKKEYTVEVKWDEINAVSVKE